MDWARQGAGWPNREASRFVESRPHRWHVQAAGPADAPRVLLLHGAGGATHSWRGVLPDLARDHRVMAPDLPGHGFTRLGARWRSGLPAMAEDAAALMAAEDFAPDVIVGHSAGAAVALRLALDMARKPRLVIGFNAALGNFPGLAGWLFPIMAKMLAANPLTALVASRLSTEASVARLIEGTGSRIDAEGLALYGRLISDRAHVDGALRMMAQWSLDRLNADLPRLEVPALLIAAEKDLAVPPETSEQAAGRMQAGKAERWPGLGHLAHEEAPARAAEAIRAAAKIYSAG